MEQMELDLGLLREPGRFFVELNVSLSTPNDGVISMTLEEAKALYQQLWHLKHLWGDYSGR